MANSKNFCKVSSNNIGMLRFIGGIFLFCALFSIISGKTYYRRSVVRAEEPMAFWVAVGAYFIIGTMMVGGTIICPIE